jgi:uncharacterized protein (TIGR02391 family)
VLADTDTGLTNKQIDELLAAAKIRDPTPRSAGPGTYVSMNKRDRVYMALSTAQTQSGAGNVIVAFIHKAMHPARYASIPDVFEERRHQLNIAFSFDSLELHADGKLHRARAATTLTDARRRAQRLRTILQDRGAHPRLLAACVAEIRDENYFHSVLEGAKSLAEEIRRRTGSQLDGIKLVQETLQITAAHPVPLLALNRLQTETERSRQQGLEVGVRAIFSAARNPTAHEPKFLSTMSEQDAVDLLTQMSYLHRRLDECTDTGHLRTQ